MRVDKFIPSLDGYWLMSINFSWKLRQVDTWHISAAFLQGFSVNVIYSLWSPCSQFMRETV